MGGNTGQTCNTANVPNSAFKPGVATATCPNTLLPVAGSCTKETSGMPSLPSAAIGVAPNLHHQHHPQPPQHSSPPLCPPYPHPQPMDERLPPPMPTIKDTNMTHPAFPVSMPMWLQHSQSYNLSHLQQVLNHEKALLASQYLTDPFAKAPFLDLARMGHYPLSKKLFGCPQCRYITDRKNNLKRHVATMHQECDKTLECCGVVFKNKASLRDHVLIFHSNGYMCRFCGRNFCRKALLKRHLTVHSGQKDYICVLCDYATSHKSNLERHKKVHERQSQDSDNESGQKDMPPSTSSTNEHSHTHHQHINTHFPIDTHTKDLIDDDLDLSPINDEDDPNSLINVVDLPNP